MRECVDIIYYAKRFSLCELSNMGKEIDYKWKKFDELSLDDLKEIITRPKNAISKQYKALFSFEGVEFEITEDGREQIAQLAVEKKIGARGLRSIMEKLLLDCMYDIPDKDSVDKVVLSKESVISNRPIIVYKEKAKIKKKVGEN